MATKAEASGALTYNALRLFHEGRDCIQEVSMAKLMTQRAVLDARLGPIGCGTDEIMKEILGKTMGL